jgi:hypothetical protein
VTLLLAKGKIALNVDQAIIPSQMAVKAHIGVLHLRMKECVTWQAWG